MDKLYRISPLEKKSVEYYVDVYEELEDGSIRGFEVTETWRWGYGFRELEDPVYDFEKDCVRCNPQIGWGCDLDDLISVQVEFQGEFTDEEKEEIEEILRGEREDEEGRYGTAWIYDGDHNWQIESDSVSIIGPFKIDLVDANGYGETAIIERDVKPKN